MADCDRGEELQKLILQRIDERERDLLSENESLRGLLQTLHNDLVCDLLILTETYHLQGDADDDAADPTGVNMNVI